MLPSPSSFCRHALPIPLMRLCLRVATLSAAAPILLNSMQHNKPDHARPMRLWLSLAGCEDAKRGPNNAWRLVSMLYLDTAAPQSGPHEFLVRATTQYAESQGGCCKADGFSTSSILHTPPYQDHPASSCIAYLHNVAERRDVAGRCQRLCSQLWRT